MNDDTHAKHKSSTRLIGVAFLVLILLAYGALRYAASGMETSQLPQAWAVPITHEDQTLMTFQQGDAGGQPLIFVHGTPGAADNWASFLEQPRPGYRVIAVDRPGFGESTPTTGLPDIADQARALRPLLESLRGKHPILIGHSLGAPIVTQAAADFPELVGAIVLVAGSLSPSVENIYTIQYVGDLPMVRQLLPRSFRNSNHELIPLRHGLERLAPRLADIACPVSIVHGTEDTLVPFENVAFMETHFLTQVIQDIIVLEGENHFLPWTAQETIWSAAESLGTLPGSP